MLIAFTPTVGVAPGTTTMNLGSQALTCLNGPCPPDPVRYYTSPPNVKTGWASGASGPTRQGMQTIYDPYATESQLRSGLRGLGGARLGVGVVAAVLAFTAVLGYGFFKRKGSKPLRGAKVRESRAKKAERKALESDLDQLYRQSGYALNTPAQSREIATAIDKIHAKLRAL